METLNYISDLNKTTYWEVNGEDLMSLYIMVLKFDKNDKLYPSPMLAQFSNSSQNKFGGNRFSDFTFIKVTHQ